MNAIGRRLYDAHLGRAVFASREVVDGLLTEAVNSTGGSKFSARFLRTEWEQVVDAWHLNSWEEYRDVSRLGRKTRLSEPQRTGLWTIFEQVLASLNAKVLITPAAMFTRLAGKLRGIKNAPFTFAVVDEAQDVSIAQLRFLAALCGNAPNGLFFAGDLGQRIFQQPFSWKAMGVDVRGRSSNLKINYRTSHQIRMYADRLLGVEVSDVDGITEQRKGTISLFNGPRPQVEVLGSQDEEMESVADWLMARKTEGIALHEIGVFVRSAAQLDRARKAVDAAGLALKVLDENADTTVGRVSVSTMHLAKGLEFKCVVVMACDDDVIPLQERIESVVDDSDLEEVYNTERHLLYVACTRARDRLLVTAMNPGSEFLDDLSG